MHRRFFQVAVTAVCLSVAGFTATAEPSVRSVKARFLVNFALYTYWPAAAFVDEHAPLNICLYGQDPFGPSIDRAAAAHHYAVGGGVRRSLNVWRTNAPGELDDCHVVFVSGITVDAALIERISAPYRLIVGESAGLTRHGGHIHVYPGEGGMQFEVNLGAVNRAGLSLSSHVLRLASIVDDPMEDDQ